jgi:hypothetical protein
MAYRGRAHVDEGEDDGGDPEEEVVVARRADALKGRSLKQSKQLFESKSSREGIDGENESKGPAEKWFGGEREMRRVQDRRCRRQSRTDRRRRRRQSFG